MDLKTLYYMLMLCFITNRLYVFAPDGNYFMVKVYHGIGIYIQGIAFLSYIVSNSKGSDRSRAALFFVYYTLAFSVFSICQLTMDHELAAEMWANGVKDSALNQIIGHLGFVQDLFIPMVIIAVACLFERRLNERRNNDNG